MTLWAPNPNFIVPTAPVMDDSNRAASTEFVTRATREKLTASRIYYVRSDGSNSNNGLTNTAAGAFLTIQYALNTLGGLDVDIYNVTIQVQDGTWTEALTLEQPEGHGVFTLLGNAATPTNCILSVTSANAIFGYGVERWVIRGFQIQVATAGHCLLFQNSLATVFYDIVFGACSASSVHIYAINADITCGSNYTIAGGAGVHWESQLAGSITVAGITVTLTGTPAFTIFAYSDMTSIIYVPSVTFSGSATGTRYSVLTNAVINTAGGGATYLPGSVAGSTDGFGAYV